MRVLLQAIGKASPVTANTPPTTAHSLVKRRANERLDSVIVAMMGDMSKMNHTEGICISPLRTAVSYSVTEYRLVFVLDPGRAPGACHAANLCPAAESAS